MSNKNIKKRKLEEFDFSKDIIDKVKPIVHQIEKGDRNKAQKAVAELCLELCEKIGKNAIKPVDADRIFTLLSIYVGDNFSDFKFDADIDKIIFEGMILHDLGKSYGADMEYMKKLARQYLKV